jgi:hypothetical protein
MAIPAQSTSAGRRGRAVAAPLLALALVACLLFAGAARADAPPPSLLRTATTAVQGTVAQTAALPGQAAANLPAPIAVPPVVPAAVQDVSARADAVTGAVVERVDAAAGAVAQAVPQSVPVAHAVQTVTRTLQPAGAQAETPAPVSSRSAGTSPPRRSGPAPVPAAPSAEASAAAGAAQAPAGVAAASTTNTAAPVSAGGRAGRGDAALAPRALGSVPAAPLVSPGQAAAAGADRAKLRSGHRGAQPPAPAPVPGQGGPAAQAVAGSSVGTGLEIVLVLSLLAWLAGFLRRLRPPGDAAGDLRLLLILDRPG